MLNADDPRSPAMAVPDAGTGRRPSARRRRRRALCRRDARRLSGALPSTSCAGGRSAAGSRYGLAGEHHAGQRRGGHRGCARRSGSRSRGRRRAGRGHGHLAPRMRCTERADGVTVNDAYNANPDSMRAALKALAAIGRARRARRTVAVLGEMLELGESSPRSTTRSAGWSCASTCTSCWWWAREPGRSTRRLPGGLVGRRVGVRAGPGRGARAGSGDLAPGDVVLFKASRDAPAAPGRGRGAGGRRLQPADEENGR